MAAGALAVAWLAVAILVATVTTDVIGWVVAGVAVLGLIGTVVLAAGWIYRLTGATLRPLIGRPRPWDTIVGVDVVAGPLGLPIVELEISEGRRLFTIRFDPLGSTAWTRRFADLLADRARAGRPMTPPPAAAAGHDVPDPASEETPVRPRDTD